MGTETTCYGIKSEQTQDGIVWHVMRGYRTPESRFATWTEPLSTHTDHAEARRELKTVEWYAADCPPAPGQKLYYTPAELVSEALRVRSLLAG